MAQLSVVDTIVRIRHRLADSSELVVLISFLLVFLFISIRAENFLSLVSLTNILTIASIKGIFVVGMAMLMISGEFDPVKRGAPVHCHWASDPLWRKAANS